MAHSSEISVFRDDAFVGTFRRDGAGYIDFTYDRETTSPISLSLPLDQRSAYNSRAAQAFLDNLLPDNAHVRRSWARRLGVPNTPFDLVREMGQDVAGALVLLPEGQTPVATFTSLIPVSADEIAGRIARISHDANAWLDPEQVGLARMSLAGAQGKFALARVDGQWCLPSANTPSTHIFKPPAERFPEMAELEAGSLVLAQAIGIDAPDARVVKARGQRSYLVERFDRDVPAHGVAGRIHAEDMTQALGESPDRKYQIPAERVIGLLARNAPEEDVYRFVQMLAFNAAIGNADAHAKNYTIMLRPDGPPRLAPLYDSLPTGAWPGVDTRLAMKIGQATTSEEVNPSSWRELATKAGIDPDRTQEVAVETCRAVAGHAHDAYRDAGTSPQMLERVDALVAKATGAMLKTRSVVLAERHSRFPELRGVELDAADRPSVLSEPVPSKGDDDPQLG